MTPLLRRSASALSCALLLGWTAPAAGGSGLPNPDPLGAAGTSSPSSTSPPGSTSYSTADDDFSLTVSPTRLVFGQADTGTSLITVINRGRIAMAITVRKRNFTASPDGSLLFQDDAPYAAADWVTVIPTSFDLAPGATRTVSTAVRIANDPDQGDHQVAIVFTVPAGKTDANVKVNRGIATPVYITVPGPVDESAELTDLSAPWFALDGPVAITAKVRSTGTVHRDFRGATPLRIDTAGSPAAFPDFTVVRGATRDVSTTWEPPMMCVCHPSVSIRAADGSVDSLAIRVIVFPLHLLGMLVAAALIILVGLRLRRRRFRLAVAAAVTRRDTAGGSSDA